MLVHETRGRDQQVHDARTRHPERDTPGALGVGAPVPCLDVVVDVVEMIDRAVASRVEIGGKDRRRTGGSALMPSLPLSLVGLRPGPDPGRRCSNSPAVSQYRRMGAQIDELVATAAASRDRVVDFLRAVGILAVVFGHWLIGMI